MPPPLLITFTSDFGTRGYYTGAVKGSILNVCPEVRIVDLSHEIASHDLLEAAFTLSCACVEYPSRTVHLVVVDPGVGSNRRGIILSTERHLFVAPDNGVLSMVCTREQITRTVSIEAQQYFRTPVSATFHGRDILGPVAAWLARGVEIHQFGPDINDYVRLPLPVNRQSGPDQIEGFVLHVDKFGNIITSLTPADIERLAGGTRPIHSWIINGREIRRQLRFYAEAGEDECFFLVGSSGYFEIAVLKKSAASQLKARRGQKVQIHLA